MKTVLEGDTKTDFLWNNTIAVTVGLFVGFFAGIVIKAMRAGLAKKRPGADRADSAENQEKPKSTRITYLMLFVFVVLLVGFIWTVYFLLLGLIDPAQTEYATNVSQLIVSVLTVFSIMVAFLEFWRRR